MPSFDRRAEPRADREDAAGLREPRMPYNGAAGVPIREEIVGRHGETVITRNSYGARCLNMPNVLSWISISSTSRAAG